MTSLLVEQLCYSSYLNRIKRVGFFFGAGLGTRGVEFYAALTYFIISLISTIIYSSSLAYESKRNQSPNLEHNKSDSFRKMMPGFACGETL